MIDDWGRPWAARSPICRIWARTWELGARNYKTFCVPATAIEQQRYYVGTACVLPVVLQCIALVSGIASHRIGTSLVLCWYYSGTVLELRQHYDGVAVALLWYCTGTNMAWHCYAIGVTGTTLVLHLDYSGTARLLHWHHTGAGTALVQYWYYTGTAQVLHWGCAGTAVVLHWYWRACLDEPPSLCIVLV